MGILEHARVVTGCAKAGEHTFSGGNFHHSVTNLKLHRHHRHTHRVLHWAIEAK